MGREPVCFERCDAFVRDRGSVLGMEISDLVRAIYPAIHYCFEYEEFPPQMRLALEPDKLEHAMMQAQRLEFLHGLNKVAKAFGLRVTGGGYYYFPDGGRSWINDPWMFTLKPQYENFRMPLEVGKVLGYVA